MKKILIFICTAVSLNMSCASFANSTPEISSNANSYNGAVPGFYMGVGLGYGGMNTPELNGTDKMGPISYRLDGSTEKIHGIAGQIYAGYLWAIPHTQGLKAGLETGFNSYAKNRYTLMWLFGFGQTDWTYSGYNIDLLGVARYNVANTGFNIFGKAGAAYVSQTFTMNDNIAWIYSGPTTSNTAHKVLPKVALGVGYDFNQNVGINLIYDHIFGAQPCHISDPHRSVSKMNQVASVSTFTTGITYHFG